ncbi:membrane progestin receptor beta-like [Tubulanus polymorphus]|uniref:membrane progestin receptor beta-like n=1 Tax=Tubulanus polymorphus TaxID=672921 RepID=UPI003DA5B2B8
MNKKRTSIPQVPTRLRHEVPVLFQEPNIHTGFREPHHPWLCYIFSIFQVHNECMNVWTHVIAAILVLVKLINMSDEIDFINDRYSWDFLAGIFATLLLFLCSSGAHCLQSKSETVHYFCFMVDYAGIGMYGFCCAQLHFTYSADESLYRLFQTIFIPIGIGLGFLTCYLSIRAKIKYKRPYPYARKLHHILPVFAMYIWLILPVVHMLFHCIRYETKCNESLPSHIRQIVCFFVSGAFYAGDIPQKILPIGWCDFIGHSHQLFHFFISMSSFYKLEAVRIDFRSNGGVIRARPEPTFFSAFGPLLFLIACEILCILSHREQVHEKIARVYRVQEKEMKKDE